MGWNVVTGYLPSVARNMGEEDQLDHDERYERADEYLEVVYKLLEGSWEEDAVVADRQRGVFVDPDKVHPINHQGTYFSVPGIALTEPSPQRTPVIYQAGASPRGIRFAAENAEAVFITNFDVEGTKEAVRRIREATVRAGRDADAIKIFALQTVITAETEQEAQDKFADYQRYIDPVGGLTLMSGWTGQDLSTYELDEPITNIESNAIQSTASAISAGTDEGSWTVETLGRNTGICGFGPVVVGSGESVAEQLIEIEDITGVDGFNLAYAVTPGTFEDFVEFVVPELHRRGRYKTAYRQGTLRNKLHGRGDRLPAEHRGARFGLATDVRAEERAS